MITFTRIVLLIVLSLEILPYFVSAAVRLRQQHTAESNSSYRILFIGGSHTFFASALPIGFISVIRNTLSQISGLSNIDIDVFGGNNYLIEDIYRGLPNYLEGLQSSVPQFQTILLEAPIKESGRSNPSPTTIAIVMLGYDDVVKDATRHSQRMFRDLRVSFSHILAALIDANISHIAVCTPFLFGEKVDYTNPFDEELEELSGVLKVTAKLFQVDVIDIRMDMLKATEKLNVENLSGSILTYDGEHLNELGNNVVSISLLKYLGLELHHNIQLPSPPRKIRRYHNRYQEDDLLEESRHSGHQYVDEMDWKFDEL